jgi:hypothetical protein
VVRCPISSWKRAFSARLSGRSSSFCAYANMRRAHRLCGLCILVRRLPLRPALSWIPLL